MATIVVDEFITKLGYEHDEATLKQAEKLAKQLEAANKAAAESADELSAENRKLAEHTDTLTRAQLDLSEQIAESTSKAGKLKDEQKDLKDAAKKAGGATDEQKKRLAELDTEIKKNERHTRELREESARLSRQKQKVSQESRKVSRAQADAAKQARKAANDQRKLANAMRKVTEAARGEATGMAKLAEQIQGVAGGQLAADAVRAVATGVFELGRNVVETGASFETLRARLKTVEGSSEGAAKAFSLIQDFTRTTPFQLDEVTTAFVRLKSLGLDASRGTLEAFGNIAAAQGKRITDFAEAVADASTNEFERLKEFGIKASKQGEQVTFTFKGQQTAVKATAKDISEFLTKLGTTDFAGAMADQMATTSGAISNFKDTLAQAFDAIAQRGPLEEFNKLLSVLANSIAGDSGLGKILADVLVIALRTVRELFEQLPSEGTVRFFQALVDTVGLLLPLLIDLVGQQGGVISSLMEFGAIVLEVVNTVFSLIKRLKDVKDRLGGIPGPLDLIGKAFEATLWLLDKFADALKFVLDLFEPVIQAFESFAEKVDFAVKQGTLSSLDTVFERIGGAVLGLAGDLGILSTAFERTGSVAGAAMDAVDEFYKSRTVQELTEATRAGDTRAEAELRRRSQLAEQQEGRDEAARQRQREIDEKRKRATDKQARALAQFEGERIKDHSVATLQALMSDPTVPEKVRKRAEKEIDRRERTRKKKGAKAAEALQKSFLSADIEKQIEDLAQKAGKRAAARAQLRGPLTAAERNRIELQERKAVQSRLTTRYEKTGELPPGLAMDLTQIAATPNIEQVGGKLAPPVITINTQRVEVTGNTFEAIVNVEGPVSATPQQVANAIVSQAQPMTFQGVARAIQNSLTNERR